MKTEFKKTFVFEHFEEVWTKIGRPCTKEISKKTVILG